MGKTCELGYCPYAELYAAQAYDLSCDNCQYCVEIGNWTDEELESLQKPLKEDEE